MRRFLQSLARPTPRRPRTIRQYPHAERSSTTVSLFAPPVSAQVARATGHYRALSTTRGRFSAFLNRNMGDADNTALNIAMACALGIFFYSLDQITRPARMRPHKLGPESLEMVASHPAVAARLGSPLVFREYEHDGGWFFANKPKIEHLTLKDTSGRLRLRVKFHVTGPNGPGVVFAEVQSWGLTVDFVYLIVQFGEGEELVTILDNRDELAMQEQEQLRRQILRNPLLRAKNKLDDGVDSSEVEGQPNQAFQTDTHISGADSDTAPKYTLV